MIELERYELNEGPAYKFAPEFAMVRRDFLKTIGFGLSLVLLLDGNAEGQQAMPKEIGAWLHLGEDGSITVFCGKAEVGQNIRTSLTQAVAEELHCLPASIRIVFGDTDLTPFDMGTFGSRTTPFMAPQLRSVAAAAREEMLGMAAEKWQVERTALVAEAGCVKNKQTGASIRFAEITSGKQLVKAIDAGAKLTPASDWRVAGTSLPKVNARDMVTGKHQYTSDMKRPGMLYGRVLRPESFGAKLTALDSNQVTGVKVVRDGDFAGVAAESEFAATKAVGALKPEWTTVPQQPGSKELFAYLKANPEGAGHEPKSEVEEALKAADHKVESAYTVAYIAHTPLEPRAAVAEWTGDKLTVWTGTQRPFGVKEELAKAFSIPANHVRVIVPDTGSGYGGKHTGECAIEAARLSKGAGKPVKVIWTREEELTWAYFRPAGLIEIRAGVAKDGTVTAWDFHNYNSGSSGIETPYDVSHKQVQFHSVKSPLRQGSYRGLAATANHFARECQMDELAHAVGMDPLAFRYKNLSNPRMKAVIAAASERFGWGKPYTSAGRGAGIACGFEKGGYVACCAEVSTAGPAKIKIERVTIAFECGAIVNPKHLENQVEGSVVMAIGGALFEKIDFENGRILNARLSKYRVPRFSDLPMIETVLVNRKDLPSAGAGETPIVGLAPAVGNAIFQATGIRTRSMPMLPSLTATNS